MPVRAEYDSAWTQDQLDAVKKVEAFEDLYVAMRQDPHNWADWATLLDVIEEPLLASWFTTMTKVQEEGEPRYGQGYVKIPVKWFLGPVQDLGERKEIDVSYCLIDVGHLIEADGQTSEVAQERRLYTDTVQFIPNVGWRVIKSMGGLESC
jgi:hypothetical protein